MRQELASHPAVPPPHSPPLWTALLGGKQAAAQEKDLQFVAVAARIQPAQTPSAPRLTVPGPTCVTAATES